MNDPQFLAHLRVEAGLTNNGDVGTWVRADALLGAVVEALLVISNG